MPRRQKFALQINTSKLLEKTRKDYLDVSPDMRLRGDVFIEPTIQQHVAYWRTHGDKMKTEEWKIVKSKKMWVTKVIYLHQLSPPGCERHVEVLGEVENVERKPAEHKQCNSGQQQMTPTNIPLFFTNSPGAALMEEFQIILNNELKPLKRFASWGMRTNVPFQSQNYFYVSITWNISLISKNSFQGEVDSHFLHCSVWNLIWEKGWETGRWK